MKLYIESVFDKDTNKLEDVKQKAIDAANKLEAQHGDMAAGKIYYFANKLGKLIVATGKVGKDAMMADSQILMVKDIPELQFGDIPTKFAKYQELVIPAIDWDRQKVVFTKIRDLNGEDEIYTGFKITELPNNNTVHSFEGYKVELIDEQPKLLKIETSEVVNGEISFMVGSFNTIDLDKDYIDIKINGKHLRVNIGLDENSKWHGSISDNETDYFAKVELVEQYDDILPGQEQKGASSAIWKITISGFTPLKTNISILGNTDESYSNEAYGYIQNSIEVERIDKFAVPYPYTDIATKIEGVIDHAFQVSKKVPDDKGVTFGAVMNVYGFDDRRALLEAYGQKLICNVSYKPNDEVPFLLRISNKSYELKKFKSSDISEGKGFYVQLSLNFVSKYATVTVNDKSETIDLSDMNFKGENIDRLKYAYSKGLKVNFIANAWYWIGDNIELDEALKDK